MRDCNRNQASIGVVFITNIMREAFHRFGCILSIDSMKNHMNDINWPFSAPVVLDAEWQITPIFEML